MRALTAPIAGTWLLLAATPVVAHPHVFVDAGLRLVLDAAGRITSVDVTWRYDELYTLILLEDYGLDPDFDLSLTEEEVAETLGFDLNWGAGFEGGLSLSQGGVALEIGPPAPVSLVLLPSGQIETTHRRPVSGAPEGGGRIDAQVYDPAFYIAFEMILPTTIEGAPSCVPDLLRADLDAAYEALDAALQEIGGFIAAEDNFPAVGALFADRVVIACVD